MSLPLSLCIKVQEINGPSSEGRGFSGQKNNKQSAQMSNGLWFRVGA